MMYKQKGVAALTVTTIILFIATIAIMYSNKASFVFQKNSSNNYQYDMALQAAEYGITDIMPILNNDLALLNDADTSNDGSTVFLEKNPVIAAGASCKADPSSSSPYSIKQSHQAKNIPLISSITNVAPGLAYNVLLQATGGKITAISTGCAGNTKADNDTGICAEDGNSNAIVRRVVDLGASLTPAKSAISARGYIDIDTTLTVDLNAGETAKANCGILFGTGGKDKTDSPNNCDATTSGKWNPENDPQFCLSTTQTNSNANNNGFLQIRPTDSNKTTEFDSSLASTSADDFFASYFAGKTKSEIKAEAAQNGMVISPARCPTAAEVTTIRNAATKILWLEGDLSLATACVSLYDSTGSTPIAMVINGNLTGPNPLSMQQFSAMNTFLYVKNVFLSTPVKITNGSIAIEENWDIDALGVIIKDAGNNPVGSNAGANTMKDALSMNPQDSWNKTARGAIHIQYKPISVQISKPSSDKKPDNWIDY
ncbi:hypothetical protein ABHF33_13835 [Chitinibacter sp. FCG-7]|uniref:Type 4 fimbrial biogenesis protein PilX N-terminal domain-containing protein n=1 Tax=Chitinibacter mangrovi TaxID=3153927 RepID=A0AAU7F8E7_9NEIS